VTYDFDRSADPEVEEEVEEVVEEVEAIDRERPRACGLASD